VEINERGTQLTAFGIHFSSSQRSVRKAKRTSFSWAGIRSSSGGAKQEVPGGCTLIGASVITTTITG